MGAISFSLLLTSASFARSLVLGPLVELHAGGGGCDVSIDGDVMALTNYESVTMLKQISTGWTIEAVLKQPGNENGETTSDFFGNAQSVKGDTVVVGASYNGTAFVFRRRENGNWPLEATLQPPVWTGTIGNGLFGSSASFDHETAVLGAPLFDWSGAAFVYVRNNTSWSLQAQLRAGDPATGSSFGRAVSISGNRIVVSGGGALYLFERENDAWTQVAKLHGKQPFDVDSQRGGIGQGVFVRGQTMVASSKKMASVFMWNQLDAEPKLIKPYAGNNVDQIGQYAIFGTSVAVSETEDIIAVGVAGFGAYLYKWRGTRWVNESLVRAPNSCGSVGISGSTFVIGTYNGAYAIEVGA